MKRSKFSLLAIPAVISLVLCTGCFEPGNKKSESEIKKFWKEDTEKAFSVFQGISEKRIPAL